VWWRSMTPGARSSLITGAGTLITALLLAWPTLAWPMTYDDLHLIRAFSAAELRELFVDTWDVDRLENAGYRPLSVLFNHARYLAFGENVVAHRLFLLVLFAAFSGVLAATMHDMGLAWPESLAASVLGLCSRYSVYHLTFLTDGIHVAQGLAVLCSARWWRAWVAEQGWYRCVMGGVAFVVALLLREDSLAAAPAIVLIAALGVGSHAFKRRRLAWVVLALGLLTAAFWLWRSAVVPGARSPGRDVAGALEYVARAFQLSGAESFDLPSRWIVCGWLWAPMVLALAVALSPKAPPAKAAMLWTVCAVLACSTALTVRRENLLFFPVVFAGAAYASALRALWDRAPRARVMVVLLLGCGLLGEAYVSREFQRIFHPKSTTSVRWMGDFVYGFYSGAIMPASRREAVVEHLRVMRIQSADEFIQDLPRRTYMAQMRGQYDPTNESEGRLFVPRLHFRAFRP